MPAAAEVVCVHLFASEAIVLIQCSAQVRGVCAAVHASNTWRTSMGMAELCALILYHYIQIPHTCIHATHTGSVHLGADVLLKCTQRCRGVCDILVAGVRCVQLQRHKHDLNPLALRILFSKAQNQMYSQMCISDPKPQPVACCVMPPCCGHGAWRCTHTMSSMRAAADSITTSATGRQQKGRTC